MLVTTILLAICVLILAVTVAYLVTHRYTGSMRHTPEFGDEHNGDMDYSEHKDIDDTIIENN